MAGMSETGALGPRLVGLPAVVIARSVRERVVSPGDVVAAHLERIDRLESTIRAFRIVRHTESLAEAEALSKRDDLDTLPLAGVPVAIKDNVDVAGTATRHGSAATSTAPAERDDELVVRLRSAGCIVIGKTQMPELAIWPFTEPVAFASTRNLGIAAVLRGDRPAGAPPRWRRAWPRWRSVPMEEARFGFRQRAAASWD
jgi:amidase